LFRVATRYQTDLVNPDVELCWDDASNGRRVVQQIFPMSEEFKVLLQNALWRHPVFSGGTFKMG
jgi:hypothetical protein